MAVVDMVNNIKELFPDYVVLIKLGNFYECYNIVSNILAYLFKYKIKTLTKGDKVSGFPIVSYNKIISNLEKRNINYISIDKKHNYEEIDKMNYKKKNKYKEVVDRANKYINIITRVDRIRTILLKDSSKINDVERLLYER